MTLHVLFLLFHFKHYLIWKKKEWVFADNSVSFPQYYKTIFCDIVSIEQHIRGIREAYG